jgi:hypothetical protein
MFPASDGSEPLHFGGQQVGFGYLIRKHGFLKDFLHRGEK